MRLVYILFFYTSFHITVLKRQRELCSLSLGQRKTVHRIQSCMGCCRP